MNYDDETITVIAIINEGFIQSEQKPVAIPQKIFKEAKLSFEKVNQVLDQFAKTNVYKILSRPSSPSDKAHYEIAMTAHQKKAEKTIRDELQHTRDLQMLQIYFGKVCNVYDVIAGGYVGFEDPQLNRCYTYLTLRIEEILDKDDFKELKDEMPFIYESLLGSYEDLDISWEYMRPELFGFLGKLEKIWLKEAIGQFKLNKDEEKLLDLTDKAIADHSERKKRANENFEKRLEQEAPKIREQMFGGQQAGNNEAIKDDVKQPLVKTGKILFDTKASLLVLDGKECEIPDESLEYYVCKLSFKNRKAAAKEEDILEKSVKSQDSQRAVYDAMLRINKKAKTILGIEKLLVYKAAKIRINKKYR